MIDITKDSLKLRGKIDHSDKGIFDDKSEYWYGYQYYDTSVKRALYIEDILYTFSNKTIKANKLNDLSLVKDIELIKEKEGDFEVIN